jgi:protein-disulfide isomerase
MFRRLLVSLIRRAFLFLLLICLGCSAQSAPPDVVRLVEKHVRATYSVPSDVKVIIGTLRSSDFPNYDALTVTFDNGEKKQDFEFLLAKDHKTLLRVTKLDLTKDPYAELMKKIDVTDRPTRGNKSAKVIAINYDDFQCPYCSKMHETLFPTLFSEYGDRVLFIYKDYPLEEMHPWAVHAAVNANCLAAQNNDAYWDYADYLHRNREAVNTEYKEKGRAAANAAVEKHFKKEAADAEYNDKGLAAAKVALDKLATLQGEKHGLDGAKLQACIKAQDEKAVRASMKEGDKVGVSATPALFVNGAKVDGAQPIEELRLVFDRALQDAGVAVPDHKPASADAKTPPEKPSK